MARPVNRSPIAVAGGRTEARRLTGVRRLIVALAAAAGIAIALPVILVGSATTVAGHSQLVISVPAAGQVLPASPTQISLVFSEPIEARYTSLDLLDGAGRTLLADAGAPDPADPYALTVNLTTPLADGTP